jgi:hypothetical protein
MHLRYIKIWLSITLGALATVAILNLLVDPLGAHPGIHWKAFDDYRYALNDRIPKAEMARRGDWEVIVLGSSRAKAGFPAVHSFFLTNKTCNLSLDGVTFPEVFAAFELASHCNPIKHVVLGLDFYMFSQGNPYVLDFQESRFNTNLDVFLYYSKQLLGIASTRMTFDTLGEKLAGKRVDPQERFGFAGPKLPSGVSQRDLFDKVLRQMGAGYAMQKFDLTRMDLVRQIVQACRDRHIDLKIAIMPVHALDIELLHAVGRWNEFEQWKTDLVEIVATNGAGGQVALWDFSGYSGPPAEVVPPAGDTASRMKYYFENSHCLPVVGGMMLDRMFGPPGTNEFGVLINQTNFQAHQTRILEDRAAYAKAHPDDMAWIQRIVKESTKPASTAKK